MRKPQKLCTERFFTSEPHLIKAKCKLLETMGFIFTRSTYKVLKTYSFDSKLFTGTKDGEFLLFDIETYTLESKSKINVPELVTFCLILTPALNLVACNLTTLFLLNLRTQKIDFSLFIQQTSILCLEVLPNQEHFICISQTCLLIFNFPNFTQTAKIQLQSSLNFKYLQNNNKYSLVYPQEIDFISCLNQLDQSSLDLSNTFIQKIKFSRDYLVLITLNNQGKILINDFGSQNDVVSLSLSEIRASGFCLAELTEKTLFISGIDKKISKFLITKSLFNKSDQIFDEITDINLNITEKILFICCADYSISIVKSKNLEILSRLPGITALIKYLAYIPDKDLIISQIQGCIIAYDTKTRSFKNIKESPDLSCCLTSDYKQLIIGSTSIEIFDIDSLFLLKREIGFKKSYYLNLIKLEFQSLLLIFIDSVNDIVFWPFEKTHERCKISLGTTKILSISIFSKAKYLIASQETGICTVLRLRNITNELPFEFHTSTVTCAQFQKNLKFFLSGSNDSKIVQWDLCNHQVLKVFKASSGVSALVLNDTDEYFTAGHLDGLISIWSLNTQKKISESLIHASEITGLKYMNTDLLISASKDNAVKIINLKDFSIKNTILHSHPIFGLDISSSQKYFSVCYNNTVKVYMTHAPSKSLKFSGHKKIVYCVCIFNRSQKILSGSFDNTIKVWSIVNKNCEESLSHHTACVWNLRMNLNENAFISCSWDNKAIIWDLNNFQPLHTLNFSISALWGLEFTKSSGQAIFFLDNTLELRDIQTILKQKT